MNHDNSDTAGGTTDSLMPGACPAAGQAPCPLRFAAAKLAAGRKAPKDSLTRCEVDAFLLLAAGHPVVVLDHETGEVWRGSVDAPFPEHGFVWVYTDLGERKLFDIALHTVWQPGTSPVCGSTAMQKYSAQTAKEPLALADAALMAEAAIKETPTPAEHVVDHLPVARGNEAQLNPAQERAERIAALARKIHENRAKTNRGLPDRSTTAQNWRSSPWREANVTPSKSVIS